jgi:sulfoquinovosidase
MAPSRSLLAALSLAVAMAPACGSDAEPPAPATFVLADGTEVDVTASGAIRLRVGDRIVFATSDSARVTARTFEQNVVGFTAIWEHTRTNEVVLPAGLFVARAGDPSAVTLRFEGGRDQAGVEVSLRPHAEGRTLVRIEATVGAGSSGSQGAASSVAVPIACDEASTFFGFGEQYNAADQRGEAFPLLVTEQGIGRQPDAAGRAIAGDLHTTYFPMPYYLDARGHGVLAKTAHRTLVDLCKTDASVAWMEAESGEPLELVVFHGPSPLDVVRQLGDEVGRPRVPPAWAFSSTWIGAQGGRDEVLARAAQIEEAEIPSRVLWVQDWTGERKNFDGGSGVQYRWVADEARYPDLAGMIAGLKQRGFRFLSYANPFVVPGLEHFDAMAEGGMLLRREDGSVYEHIAPNGGAATPDFTNPATYEYVRGYFRDMAERLHMDGFMADFGEWAPLDAVYANGADPRAEHNLYPVRWHTSWRGLFDEIRPDGDYVVFARSGFTGVHAVAQVYWVGDQEADFSPYDGLPTVLPAMLTLGLSGIPFVTHDIAGFSGGPSTKELYLRWTELGAFTPIMRTHEGNNRDENWAYHKDQETLAHFTRFSRIHERLAPEIVALAEEAGRTGAPIVRHLMLAYPDDATSRATDDEFLLGDRLLVAPVVTEGARSRRVYFPPGAAWFHVLTGARFEGGATVEVDAPLGTPPVFARDADRTDLRAL